MEVRPRKLLKYETENGKCPFDEWNRGLRDTKTRAIIATRLNRLVQGNFGLCRRLTDKIWELKVDYGPGFRVYFAEDGETLVILLCGGDKSTQEKDIEKAQAYWNDYERE